MKKSFKLTKIFNIPVEVNYSWFIILSLIVFTLAMNFFPATDPELNPFTHWIMAIIAALLLFASLLAHELSHSLVAQRNNLPIKGITLFVFGGVAHMEKEPQSPIVEFKMAIAGPLMSFTLALIFFGLNQFFYYFYFPNALVSITLYLFLVNLIIGIFNLIPGFPLDGGRIFRAALWAYFKDLRKATAIASWCGRAFAFFLIAMGILNIFNRNIIAGLWFIFVGFFLSEAAEGSYRNVIMKNLLGGMKIGDFMTKDIISVNAKITLDKLIDDYFFKYRHAAFPVIEDDKVIGLVTFHDIKEVPKNKWPLTHAKEIIIPLGRDLTINKNLDALDALAKMARTGFGRLLVVEDSKIIGILSQKDIMRLFEFKSEIEG